MTTRLATKADFDAIENIANLTYPENYFESAGSFQSKILGYPSGCFVAEIDNVVGYVVSFPYILDEIYPINHFYKPIENPNCHYIHDLCIDKNHRKLGIAKKLLDTVLLSHPQTTVLVSVMGSENFWKKCGFTIMREVNYCNLLAYYMIRDKK